MKANANFISKQMLLIKKGFCLSNECNGYQRNMHTCRMYNYFAVSRQAWTKQVWSESGQDAVCVRRRSEHAGQGEVRRTAAHRDTPAVHRPGLLVRQVREHVPATGSTGA